MSKLTLFWPIATLFAGAAVLAAEPASAPPPPRAGQPVILDTDAAYDDLIAIMALASAGRVRLLAVSGTHGTVRPWRAAETVSGLLDRLGIGWVPVFEGAEREGKLPEVPWRPVAERLLDALRGPLRAHEPAIDGLHRTLAAASEPVDIIALGPLTHLAALLRAHPEDRARIGRVLAVGDPDSGSPGPGFNLAFDPEAAAAVLASGLDGTFFAGPGDTVPRVSIADLSKTKVVAGAPHSSATHEGELVPLAREVLLAGARMDPDGRYPLFDLAPVIGYLYPETCETVPPPAAGASDAGPRDSSGPAARHRVVRLRSGEGAAERLRRLLSRRIVPDLESIEAAHGHLGPYAVLGWLMGRTAALDLGYERHFGVSVDYRGPPRPPVSCLVDGLAVSTGASPGKRNLTVSEAEEISVSFTNRESGRTLTLRLSAAARSLAASGIERGTDLEEIVGRLIREPPSTLFDRVEGP